MRPWLAAALGLTTLALAASPRQPQRAPRIESQSSLSAEPLELGDGASGPINRQAFDLTGFPRTEASRTVTCVYPHAFAYRCNYEMGASDGALQRVVVAIPDLGRGTRVEIRFATPAGSTSASVTIVNRPRVTHEIETVLLDGGGQRHMDGNGREAPALQLVRQFAITTPSLAEPGPVVDRACDHLFAEWVSAAATEAVFVSEFGALHGGVASASPVQVGMRVGPLHLPRWLITYPRGARRVHFIAHYEMRHRVGTCAGRIVPS